MTDQNNAAQPLLTDDEIQSIWIEHGLDDEAVEDFARAIESALLSKLRAEGVQAGDARAVAALAELVACDRIKKQIASMQACVLETDDDVQELDAMMTDLSRRQPAAWEAARAVVAASQQQEG